MVIVYASAKYTKTTIEYRKAMANPNHARAAQTVAETMNAQAGYEVLTYNAPPVPIELTPVQIAILNHRREWLLARDAFALLHGRKPSQSEAIRFGRVLGARYVRRSRSGGAPHYYLAPDSETPAEFMTGRAFTHDEHAILRKLGGWATARSAFEHVYKRAATRAELIAVGRDLARNYPSVRSKGAGYYFLAPAGTPVPDLSV